ncbi:MAG: hypothetical protein ABMB14_14315 [Myxococcota bacterium]
MWWWLACTADPTGGAPTDRDVDATDTDTDGTVPGATRRLAVDHGYGGGELPVGAAFQVWAAVDPQTEVVTGWTGDVDALEAPTEWNSAGTMPDRDLALAATIEASAAPIVARDLTLAGRPRGILVAAAPAPVGLVLFFHGAGYAIDELRDNAARTTTNLLVRAGYTVVAVMSDAEAAAGIGGWSTGLDLGSNGDLQTVDALIDALRSDGTVPPSTPVYAWGMSSGGMFAHTVGATLPIAAVAAFCAAGTAEAMAATDAPTAWYLAGNDQVFPTSVADATAFEAALTARGVPTDRVVHPPTPLYDQRFERVTGVEPARSATIAASIRASGAVDPTGAWTVPGSAVTAAMDLDGLDGLSPIQVTAVAAEIEILAADHELYDDVSARLVAFFDAHR